MMTAKKKISLAAVIIIVAAAGIGYAVYQRNAAIVVIQTGKVVRQDLQQTVSANGEIKPKKSVNISSNTMGRILEMPVKEGATVREGDLLLRLESVQTEAEVQSAEAALEGAQSELEAVAAQIRSNEAVVNSAKADIKRSEAELTRVKQNLDRAEQLSKSGLLPTQEFERIKAEHDIGVAQLNAAQARLLQAEAQATQAERQREGTASRIAQQKSGLVRARDQLSKTVITSPLAGVITYLPVNVGEIAIVGVQNQPGTVLMTIADLSVITAEVRVDETDIVNVRLGQEARVRVDALGDRELKGHVSEVGNSALTGSGAAAGGPNQGTSQEARDFKVVITLDNPPAELRPGLSCTASIITATTSMVLTVPIQALTIREFDDPEPGSGPVKKIEKEGVYVVKNGTVLFRPVKTGITGTTDIEILEGLTADEEIVTGPFQVLRTLQDNTQVKVEPPTQVAQ
jgi:HlyD family secretion protein